MQRSHQQRVARESLGSAKLVEGELVQFLDEFTLLANARFVLRLLASEAWNWEGEVC